MAASTAILLSGLTLSLLPVHLCSESEVLSLLETLLQAGKTVNKRASEPGCGGSPKVVSGYSEGRVINPYLSDGTYPTDRHCEYRIQVSQGHNIRISFEEIDLQADDECRFDYVAVYDGASRTDPELKRLCGTWAPVPPSLETSGRNALIVFHSDETTTRTGFELRYYRQELEPGCADTPQLAAYDSGTVTSPSINAAGIYPNNRYCQYQIQVPHGKRVRIKFEKIDLESDDTCRYDFLRLYDGISTSASQLGYYCGTWRSLPKDIMSTGRSLLIVFHSDLSDSGTGFKLKFSGEAIQASEPGCGGTKQYVSYAYGTVTNPSIGGKYPNNRNCRYQLQAGSGQRIRIRFVKVDLEYSSNCQYDYLRLYDGTSSSNRQLSSHCGTWNDPPGNLESSGQNLLVVFHSDDLYAASGFKLQFNSFPSSCGTSQYTKRIASGSESRQNEWPWLVHLRTEYPPEAGKPGFYTKCGGVLIDTNWILTAAHCLEHEDTRIRTTDPSRVKLYLGEHNIQDDHYIEASAAKIIFHPGRTGFDVAPDDVALIKLADHVTINNEVNTICLPFSAGEFPVGTTAVVAGWGKQHHHQQASSVLMHTTLAIISNTKCNGSVGSQSWAIPVNNDLICGQTENTGQSTCAGDSGGPLMAWDGNRYYLAGITSFNVHCGLYGDNWPSVFVRVFSYVNWIGNTIRNN